MYNFKNILQSVEKIYSVYVLLSLKDGRHYTGLSSDIHSRLKIHNSGKVAATKSRRPFVLIYQEQIGELKDARVREKYLKSAAGRKYLNKQLLNKIVSGSLPD